jgi:hypothetical protein
MKKILPLILLLPCVAMGANATTIAHRKSSVATTEKIRSVSDVKKAAQASFTIKGFVRDASGQPLVGVSVGIKGTTLGTQTDVKGSFTISANLNDVLTFTYLGYTKKEVTVVSGAEVTVQLDEDSKQLSEVVVTALGIKKERREVGYSVTEVKGSELTTAKETNFASELEGKVAGVNVTTISGGPDAAVNINIRGAASFSGGPLPSYNQPLYVLNGVPMINSDNTEIKGLSMNSGGEYDNSPNQG